MDKVMSEPPAIPERRYNHDMLPPSIRLYKKSPSCTSEYAEVHAYLCDESDAPSIPSYDTMVRVYHMDKIGVFGLAVLMC